MRKILIVIDMQNDFIDAALGTKEAQAIVGAVKEKMEYLFFFALIMILRAILSVTMQQHI